MKNKDKMLEDQQREEEKEILKKTKVEVINEFVVITLGIPINFNDEIVKEIELDFNSLTGVDICDAESDALGRFYTPLPDTDYSTAYQAAISAKAPKLPFDLILEFKLKNFKMIIECTKGFLLG